MHDFGDDLLRDTDDDTDHTDLPDLWREWSERLPGSAHRTSAVLPHLPDAARLESTTSTCHVLILEDDPATQEVFSLLLAPEEGFQVDCVSEVTTCLEYLRATCPWSDSGSDSETSTERLRQPPFEVLLLDVRLRGGHLGTEVFAAAQRDPGLHLPPIVICTALADRALAAIVQDCGVDLRAYDVRVVLKPFDIDTLTTELRRAARSRSAALASVCRPGT